MRSLAAGIEPDLVARELVVEIPVVHRHLATALGKLLPTVGTSVMVLGPFRVTRDASDVTPPPGHGANLVVLLALRGGRAHAEELIECLWPEADPAVGRTRLRNVLARLRRASGDLVVRDRDGVSFAGDVALDVRSFEDDIRQALALEPTDGPTSMALARRALACCDGEFLPEVRYESWAAAARDRCRQRALAALDLVARQAMGAGDAEQALEVNDQAIALEPYDEHRYLQAARWLVGTGRTGAARAVLTRARAMWRDLGLEPSAELVTLERRVLG